MMANPGELIWDLLINFKGTIFSGQSSAAAFTSHQQHRVARALFFTGQDEVGSLIQHIDG